MSVEISNERYRQLQNCEWAITQLLHATKTLAKAHWGGDKRCVIKGREKGDLYDIICDMRAIMGWREKPCPRCGGEGCWECRHVDHDRTGTIAVPPENDDAEGEDE